MWSGSKLHIETRFYKVRYIIIIILFSIVIIILRNILWDNLTITCSPINCFSEHLRLRIRFDSDQASIRHTDIRLRTVKRRILAFTPPISLLMLHFMAICPARSDRECVFNFEFHTFQSQSKLNKKPVFGLVRQNAMEKCPPVLHKLRSSNTIRNAGYWRVRI